ncbi:protein of unknown function [Candidatus Methylomirabilis oxygeniifera]|uniref:Uncharacterized protein n=1 Tax=Methylomirabilis oxygeniifera TaxID=671143 RepID=D5MG72_METO1|nr:protein of unknown function [Candidatus Methylomirabilis oxyfera]
MPGGITSRVFDAFLQFLLRFASVARPVIRYDGRLARFLRAHQFDSVNGDFLSSHTQRGGGIHENEVETAYGNRTGSNWGASPNRRNRGARGMGSGRQGTRDQRAAGAGRKAGTASEPA